MGIKFTNNASSNITHALTADATSVSITSGTGDLFPYIIEGKDYFYATLAGNNGLEIVKVTKRVLDTMTIERAQDNTTSLSFDQGDLFELRIVAADFEDTFSHVETTLEDTVSHVETTLENTVDALNSSVDNKMSSYLPLSGGTITGRVKSALGVNSTFSSASNDSQIRICGGDGSWSQGGVGIWYGVNSDNYPGGWEQVSLNPDGQGGSAALRGYYDVESKKHVLKYADCDVLTSTGGTITGALQFTPVAQLQCTEDASSINIFGGAGFKHGSQLTLIGKDASYLPGGFRLGARNNEVVNWLDGDISGRLSWCGNDVLTSAGGTMTGRLYANKHISRSIDTAYLTLMGGSDASNGAYLQLFGKNEGSNNAGCCFFKAVSEDKSSTMLLNPDGEFFINQSLVLTSAGGTITGEILSNISTPLKGSGSSTYLAIAASTQAKTAQVVCCKDTHASTPGAVWIAPATANNSSVVYFYPDGRILNSTYSAYVAYTPKASSGVGQWVTLKAAENAALVLPTGGTWAYFWCYTGDIETWGESGVAAGGTTIASANAYRRTGFAWRIL